jgi:hypothetical protein
MAENCEAYTLGTWKGFVTYKCTLCLFDCMDEAQALEHYQAHFRHPQPQKQPAPQQVQLSVDNSGHVVATAASEVKPLPSVARRQKKRRKE